MPPGTSAESAWLLEAPPWEAPVATGNAAPTVRQDTRKQTVGQISVAEQTLGKLARATADRIRVEGLEQYIVRARGTSNLTDGVRQLPHRAARLLDHLRKRWASVVTSSEPWTVTECESAKQQGPHKSSHLDREFVSEEMLDFCRQGYWMVLPYYCVQHWRGLHVSPLGVVSQRDRRSRLIVDHSYSGVNDDTVALAPKEAMQFGRALHRVMKTVVNADDRYGPVYLSKIDIADGFYRV